MITIVGDVSGDTLKSIFYPKGGENIGRIFNSLTITFKIFGWNVRLYEFGLQHIANVGLLMTKLDKWIRKRWGGGYLANCHILSLQVADTEANNI